MIWRLALVALAGCGRISFDAVSQPDQPDGSMPIGHDEDGDGVPDTVDVCPHLTGTQLDGDGDGVGDDCDPNPTVAGDRIALFTTLRPADQPLTLLSDQDNWVQRDDSLELTGDLDVNGRLFAGLRLEMPLATARLALGFDVLANLGGAQNQFAVSIVPASAPYYYLELNEDPGAAYVEVTLWDGVTFTSPDQRPLQTTIHTGPVFFQGAFVANTGVQLDATWPGEPYQVQMTDQIYQGGDGIEVNINGLHVEIRYLCVITSP